MLTGRDEKRSSANKTYEANQAHIAHARVLSTSIADIKRCDSDRAEHRSFSCMRHVPCDVVKDQQITRPIAREVKSLAIARGFRGNRNRNPGSIIVPQLTEEGLGFWVWALGDCNAHASSLLRVAGPWLLMTSLRKVKKKT